MPLLPTWAALKNRNPQPSAPELTPEDAAHLEELLSAAGLAGGAAPAAPDAPVPVPSGGGAAPAIPAADVADAQSVPKPVEALQQPEVIAVAPEPEPASAPEPAPQTQPEQVQMAPEESGYSNVVQSALPDPVRYIQVPTEAEPMRSSKPLAGPAPSEDEGDDQSSQSTPPPAQKTPAPAQQWLDKDPGYTWLGGTPPKGVQGDVKTTPDGMMIIQNVEQRTVTDKKDKTKKYKQYRVFTTKVDPTTGRTWYMPSPPAAPTGTSGGTVPVPHQRMQPANPAPSNNGTPAPTPTPTPTPSGNGTPAPTPNGGGTPAPNGSGTPAPNGSGTPAPNGGGATDKDGAEGTGAQPEKVPAYEMQKQINEDSIDLDNENVRDKSRKKIQQLKRLKKNVEDGTGATRPFGLNNPKTGMPLDFNGLKNAVPNVVGKGKTLTDLRAVSPGQAAPQPLSIGHGVQKINETPLQTFNRMKNEPSFADNSGYRYYGDWDSSTASTPGHAESWVSMENRGRTQDWVRGNVEHSHIKNRKLYEKLTVQDSDGSHLYPHIVGMSMNPDGTLAMKVHMSPHATLGGGDYSDYATQINNLPTFTLGQSDAGTATSEYDPNDYAYVNERAGQFNSSHIVSNLIVPAYSGEKLNVRSNITGTPTPLIFSDCPEPQLDINGNDVAQWQKGVPFDIDIDGKTRKGFVLMNTKDGTTAFTEAIRNNKFQNEMSIKPKDLPAPLKEITYAWATTVTEAYKQQNIANGVSENGSPFTPALPVIIPGDTNGSVLTVEYADREDLLDFLERTAGITYDAEGNVVFKPGGLMDEVTKNNAAMFQGGAQSPGLVSSTTAALGGMSSGILSKGIGAAIGAGVALKATSKASGISAATRNGVVNKYLAGLTKFSTGMMQGADLKSMQSFSRSGEQMYINPDEVRQNMELKGAVEIHNSKDRQHLPEDSRIAIPWMLKNYTPRVWQFLGQNDMLPNVGQSYGEQAYNQQKMYNPDRMEKILELLKAGEDVDSNPLIDYYNKFMFPLLRKMYEFATTPEYDNIRRDVGVPDMSPNEKMAIESVLSRPYSDPWGFVPSMAAIPVGSPTVADKTDASSTVSEEVSSKETTSSGGGGGHNPPVTTKYNSVVGGAGGVTAFDWRTKWKANGGGATQTDQNGDLHNAVDTAAKGKGKQAADDASKVFKDWTAALPDTERKTIARTILRNAIQGLSGAITSGRMSPRQAIGAIDEMVGGSKWNEVVSILEGAVGGANSIIHVDGSVDSDRLKQAVQNPSVLNAIANKQTFTDGSTNPNSYYKMAYESLVSGNVKDGLTNYGTPWAEAIITHPGYRSKYSAVAKRYNSAATNEEQEMVGTAGLYQSMTNKPY